MKLTEYIKKFIREYLIIFAIIMIVITILRHIFSQGKYFEIKDIFIYMIGSLIGNLPSLIFYSTKSMTEKEMRVRRIIHFVVLEVSLVTFGNLINLVNGIPKTILLSFQIAIIYVMVRFLAFRDDKKDAHRINEKLKAMKDESVYELE